MSKTEMSRLSTAFTVDPTEVLIIGIDTGHKNITEHSLFDGERNAMPLDEETVQNFITLGCVQPVCIQQEEIGWVVIDGRQRVRHLREANARRVEQGLKPYRLPVVVNKDNERDLLLEESLNTHRRDDTILTKAFRALAMTARNMDMADVMNALGVSESTVKNFVRLARADKSLHNALREGKVKPAVAYRIARAETKADQREELQNELAEKEADPKGTALNSLMKAVVRAIKLGCAENRLMEAWEMGVAEGNKHKKRKKKAKKEEPEAQPETPEETPAVE
jgi:hypothetical protein